MRVRVLYDHVVILSSNHRGAGTSGEQRARDYIVRFLEDLGYKVELQFFPTPPTFSYTYITVFSLIAIAPLLVLLKFKLGALILALTGFILLLVEEELYIPILTRVWGILWRRRSANIIAKIGGGSLQFILIAHYDSTKAASVFNPKRVRFLRSILILNFASALLCLILVVVSFFINSSYISYLALITSTPLWFSILSLIHRELFHEYVPGANDNASGVAVLLGLAEVLAKGSGGLLKELLDKATIHLVFTGAEEVGLLGSHWFFRGREELGRSSIIINIDNPGAGDIVFTECEGVIMTWCSEDSFRIWLRSFASKVNVKTISYKLLPTDATPAMMRGWRATSLMSFYNGLIRNYHWYTDTPEHVNPHNLEKARELVLRLMINVVVGEQVLTGVPPA